MPKNEIEDMIADAVVHTHQAILLKAVSKAIENDASVEVKLMSLKARYDHDWLSTTTNDGFYASPLYYRFIFNHDFAKALWGEDLKWTDGDFNQTPAWCHHLKQMVIAEDPIKYLGEHI